jgi:hypothetical protein
MSKIRVEHQKRESRSGTSCPFFWAATAKKTKAKEKKKGLLSAEEHVPPKPKARRKKTTKSHSKVNSEPASPSSQPEEETAQPELDAEDHVEASSANLVDESTRAVTPPRSGELSKHSEDKEMDGTCRSPSPVTPVRDIQTSDAHEKDSSNSTTDFPSIFIPPLATASIVKFDSMTEAQKDMTVEQWIRGEIEMQYEQFKADGMRKITTFIERAAEVRRAIQVL